MFSEVIPTLTLLVTEVIGAIGEMVVLGAEIDYRRFRVSCFLYKSWDAVDLDPSRSNKLECV
jgi:hypothetical protein